MDTEYDGIPLNVINGVRCTNRVGIQLLTGWKPGNMKVRANTDKDFPQPETTIKRVHWYPVDKVEEYLDILAARAAAKKPPPVEPGDPDELLGPPGVASALGIEESTVRSYVRHSKPYWDGRKEGTPILPKPDRVSTATHGGGGTYTLREWYRGTLAAHQADRPGPGGGVLKKPEPASASD